MTFPTTGIATLLARHGRLIRINYNNVNSQYDPATGKVVKDSIPPAVVKGYFYESKKEPQYETQVSVGSRRVVFRPVDTNGMTIRRPSEGDTIEGQRDKVDVLRVEEVVSGDKTLVYICWVKE